MIASLMEKLTEETPDIFVVQKQTSLQRYGQGAAQGNFLHYISQDGQSLSPIFEAHETHIKSSEELLEALESLGLSYKILSLEEMKQECDPFTLQADFSAQGGLQPKEGLVISLGGDGTLLHAAHYTGGTTRLAGINSAPHHSVGHLCALSSGFGSDGLKKKIESLLEHPWSHFAPAHRLHVALPTQPTCFPPLALNDILFCHHHPAATSRYQISLFDKMSQETLAKEKHLSSGLWISTFLGRSAAIASYQVPGSDEANPEHFFLAIREPYALQSSGWQLTRKVLDGNQHEISLFSRIRHGLLCIDGPDTNISLGFGDKALVSLPEQGILRLATKSLA